MRVPAVTVDQMREVDRLMTEEYGILLIQMMENAGRNLAALVSIVAQGAADKSVLVIAGSGNNGGGGLVAARHLSNMGWRVRVVLASGSEDLREVPRRQASVLAKMRTEVIDGAALDQNELAGAFDLAEVIVDALLGYSLAGAPRGTAARLIEAANASRKPIVALDLPSGVSATDGHAYEPSIRAAATLTLALPKDALATDEARTRTGDLYLGDISVPPGLYSRLGLDIGPLFAEGSPIRLVWEASGWVTGSS